ncbi:MAG: SPFH domain-containing protein, partial [Bacilli bacterium]
MSGIEVFLVVLAIIVFIGLLIFIGSIRIVRQTNKYVVERLGAYHTTWTVGFHILVPFIDRVTKIVTMKEQVKDFDPQPVITKD